MYKCRSRKADPYYAINSNRNIMDPLRSQTSKHTTPNKSLKDVLPIVGSTNLQLFNIFLILEFKTSTTIKTDCIIIGLYSIWIIAIAVKTPYIPTYMHISYTKMFGRPCTSRVIFAFQEAGLKLGVTRWVPRFMQSVKLIPIPVF